MICRLDGARLREGEVKERADQLNARGTKDLNDLGSEIVAVLLEKATGIVLHLPSEVNDGERGNRGTRG